MPQTEMLIHFKELLTMFISVSQSEGEATFLMQCIDAIFVYEVINRIAT